MDAKALSFSLKPYIDGNRNSDSGVCEKLVVVVCMCLCVCVYACLVDFTLSLHSNGTLHCLRAQGHCGSSITTTAEGRRGEEMGV